MKKIGVLLCNLLCLAGILLVTAGCSTLGRPPLPETLYPELPPESAGEQLWQRAAEHSTGVDYLHVPAAGSVPAFHVVRVDLKNPRIEVAPHPPQPQGAGIEEVPADGSEIVIINANPFRYRFSFRGLDREPVGLLVVDGIIYAPAHKNWGIFWRDASGGFHITAGAPQDDRIEWAVGGYLPILQEGENVGIHGERRARTALGLTRGRDTLFILVVEGERAAYPGLTSRETAMILQQLGAWNALNLDGGGSSVLWIGGTIYSGSTRKLACYLKIQSIPEAGKDR
ncbi:MAG: phosphodiester glycosidase family protein [Sediminispirochaetaceae bacterium]